MKNKRDNRKIADASLEAAAAGQDDFAAMLASYDAVDNKRLEPGQKISGRVFHISKENVFVEISGTQEGVLPRAEILDDSGRQLIALGDTIDAFVVSVSEGILLSRKLGRDGAGSLDMLEQARASGMPVDGTVTAVNKGGVEVTVGTLRGFCPMGQLDLHFIEDPQHLIGQTLTFQVKEIKERGRNIVLSRRALLEAERAKQIDKLKSTLAVGQRLTGKVTRLAPFGVFVDLGGLDGLVPIGELSHQHVQAVEEVTQAGASLAVEIRSIEPDPKKPGQLRISLSHKATLADPWHEHTAALHEGATVTGKVVKLEAFGAFVELFPGIQGLVHISELSHKRVRHPGDVVRLGEAVAVRVLGVNRDQRRIALSLKDAVAEPADSAPVAARAAGSQVEGTVERCETFGVFVTLEGGGSALLPAAETGTPRGTDLARAFPVGTRLALEVLGTDERGRVRVSKVARERSEEQSAVRAYETQTKASGFGTLGDLLRQRAPK